MTGPGQAVRKPMREYLQEWCRDAQGEPLTDSDANEIIENLLDMVIEGWQL